MRFESVGQVGAPGHVLAGRGVLLHYPECLGAAPLRIVDDAGALGAEVLQGISTRERRSVAEVLTHCAENLEGAEG
jgi:hypothetical protein